MKTDTGTTQEVNKAHEAWDQHIIDCSSSYIPSDDEYKTAKKVLNHFKGAIKETLSNFAPAQKFTRADIIRFIDTTLPPK